MATTQTYNGGCACGAVRYQTTGRPIRTHACHCRWCQRETGSAFAINSMYEAFNVRLTSATQPEIIDTPTATNNIQWITRCPTCKVAVWSQWTIHGGKAVRIVRAGSFDEPDFFPPEHHIYTLTKQPWVVLDGSVPISEEFYDREKYWSKEMFERVEKAFAALEEEETRNGASQ